MEKRIVVFTEKIDGHRGLRLSQEAERKNINIHVVDIRTVQLRDGVIFYEGKALKIDPSDIIWFASNCARNHYIAKVLHMNGNRIWPSHEALDFADKYVTNYFFSANGIPTPKTALLQTESINEAVSYVGGYPCVIKKNISSQGKHVEIVRDENDIHEFVKNTIGSGFERTLVGKVPNGTYSFQLQEYIAESAGSDYRVLVLNGKILGCIKREASEGFKANISLGGSAKKIEIDSEMKDLVEKIVKAGKLFYAGIDFIKGKDGYLAIEINTSAQFEGFEGATGINVAGNILDALLAEKQ
ncbi:MAG TPA: RimK family alpha-L-glutamate ligase [Patescibacteria group bacterium]